jgi:hypothetical protein
MIFAIGCAIGRLSEQNLQQEADENLFLARAKSLSLSESVLYDHDDLQQVQAEALLAFYFLVVSQINRYDVGSSRVPFQLTDPFYIALAFNTISDHGK